MEHHDQLLPRTLPRARHAARAAAGGQEGVALVLTLILIVLLYVIVAELATTTKLGALSADNEAMLARMNRATENALREAEQALLDDLAQQASSGAAGPAGGGAIGGQGALPIPGAGGAGGGEGSGPSDSTQDAWFEPQAYTEGDLADLTTYTWVEDENRKFNVLCLASKDEEFARDSFHRLVTLLDLFREETTQDLGRGDAEKIATAIRDLLEGKRRTEDRPRPPLKSNEDGNDVTLPLLLEELLLLPEIPEDLIGDKVVDEKLIPGLDSVLTVYTGMRFDEGPPKPGGAPTPAGAAGQQPAAGPGRTPAGGAPSGGAPAQGGRSTTVGGASQTTGGGSVGGGSAVTNEDQAIGVGIRINVNTAPRAVLRCLMQQTDMPNEIIEALLRYRNEDVPEEDPSKTGPGGAPVESASTESGTVEEEKPKKKIFSTLDDLDQVPEFKNWASVEPKKKFISLLTTRSGAFTIHVAALQKIDEEKRQFVLKRARRVVMRIEDGEGALYPIVPLTDRSYLRVMPVDFPEQEQEEREKAAGTLDEYALQERDWNPFYLEFYLPKK